MGLVITESQTSYDFFITADGSPSICLSSSIYRPEAMHHRQGALSESLFVYHGVLSEALTRQAPPQILSVGLGCGYNEMIAVAHFLNAEQTQPFPQDFYLESFEGETEIRTAFLNWLNNKAEANPDELQKELRQTFSLVADKVSAHFQLKTDSLRQKMLQLVNEKKFVLRDWLRDDTSFTHTFGVIFFDAFSRQSTPDIWSDAFLIRFLNKVAADRCGIATYAATGSLNRALRATQFERTEMPGFSGKRQSTRAFRDVSVKP